MLIHKKTNVKFKKDLQKCEEDEQIHNMNRVKTFALTMNNHCVNKIGNCTKEVRSETKDKKQCN